MKKGTAGFTLVELIVVIAILGILAGIAIPVYSGYINKANEAADLQLLGSVNTAATFAVVDKNANGIVTKIEVTPAASADAEPTITISWKVGDATQTALGYNDIKQYVAGNSFVFKSGATKAELDCTASNPKWVLTPKAG